MSVLFTGANPGDIADASLYSANWDLLENSLQDRGNYVVSGLVPSIGTGLAVNVTSGTASIGGRVSFSSFSIAGLTNSTVNHLYVLQNGTGTSNTTGTAPANSAKLGTATTAGGVVSSVNVLRSSGRQALVRHESMVMGDPGSPASIDLSDWNATPADGFQVSGVLPSGAVPAVSAPLTLTNNDATGSGVTAPLILRHTNSGGAGANGIGTGLQWEAENTGGTVSTIGTMRILTENAASANLTTRFEFEVFQNAASRTMMRVGPTSVRVEQSPAGTADYGLLSLGGGGWAGGAGNFAGNASGTLLAFNSDAGFAYDIINAQSDGAEYFKVGATGTTTATVWDSTTNNVSTALTIRHLANTGAGAANIGTRLEWQSETTTNDTANISGQIDCVLTTATAGSAVSRMDLRVNNAGTMTNPISLTALGAFFNVPLQGNAQGLAFGRAQITFPSDADYTLIAAEYQCMILDVQTGVITATRNLIVPATLGGLWLVRNQNAQSVTVKTPAGTGITIATGKTAFVFCGGANVLRATPDT